MYPCSLPTPFACRAKESLCVLLSTLNFSRAETRKDELHRSLTAPTRTESTDRGHCRRSLSAPFARLSASLCLNQPPRASTALTRPPRRDHHPRLAHKGTSSHVLQHRSQRAVRALSHAKGHLPSASQLSSALCPWRRPLRLRRQLPRKCVSLLSPPPLQPIDQRTARGQLSPSISAVVLAAAQLANEQDVQDGIGASYGTPSRRSERTVAVRHENGWV